MEPGQKSIPSVVSSQVGSAFCTPRLERTGQRIRALHFVAGCAMCGPCFRGLPIENRQTAVNSHVSEREARPEMSEEKKPPLEPLLIPDSHKDKPKAVPAQPQKELKVVPMQPRMEITQLRQVDLLEYLTLERLFYDQRRFICKALKCGLPVEPGQYTATLDGTLLVVERP